MLPITNEKQKDQQKAFGEKSTGNRPDLSHIFHEFKEFQQLYIPFLHDLFKRTAAVVVKSGAREWPIVPAR
jgi:hypothetical protein